MVDNESEERNQVMWGQGHRKEAPGSNVFCPMSRMDFCDCCVQKRRHRDKEPEPGKRGGGSQSIQVTRDVT